ncbi:nuclear transport factor 2 family protein [Siphonobacter sp. SORGH_AS_1065]|uniref:nuclear transport factor 2 family protein n=1 Tax=Siphonobacter sp. SORGH_AS_1065 TaxID=3041795 RepID=UPI0027856FCC|nr:nuclear transport factor 2 family protein [Siphonobacter sp. SORGH_AS_1065]MDQ1089141.1 hypothetical protein [Siphonobacter sp. SORGH_AS_1065]
MQVIEEIQQHEERLRLAMIQSNAEMLDALVSDDVIVTDPAGYLLTKADDLAAHQSGQLRIESITPQEVKIKVLLETAIVFALMKLKVWVAEVAIEGLFRYTRVWHYSENRWQIVAAHISQAEEN